MTHKTPEPKFRKWKDSVRFKDSCTGMTYSVKSYFYNTERREYMYFLSNPYTMNDSDIPVPEHELEKV